MAAETIMDLRSLIRMGVVLAVDDTGDAQTATIQTNDGATHTGVEIHQAFGFASVPPGDGTLALVLAVGGDPAQMVALPLACPAGRFGGQAQGETVAYGSDGSRVAFRQGGTVEVWGVEVIVNTPTVTIRAPSGDTQVTIEGDLVVTKDISDQNGVHGTVRTLRDDYNGHDHQVPNVQSGGATITTTTPTPQDA